jgi:hypothetical protein
MLNRHQTYNVYENKSIVEALWALMHVMTVTSICKVSVSDEHTERRKNVAFRKNIKRVHASNFVYYTEIQS